VARHGQGVEATSIGSDVIAGNLLIHLLGRGEDGLLEVGAMPSTAHTAISVRSALQTEGHVPLPPYIKREDEALDESAIRPCSRARRRGALAAPTAGLHPVAPRSRTPGRAADRSSQRDLARGAGTFSAVTVDESRRAPHARRDFEISRTTASAIDRRASEAPPWWPSVRRWCARSRGAAPSRAARTVVSTQGNTLAHPAGIPFRVADRLLTKFSPPAFHLACSGVRLRRI